MCEARLLYRYTVITSPAVVPIGYVYMTRFQWWVSGLEAINNVLDILYRYMEMKMETETLLTHPNCYKLPHSV